MVQLLFPILQKVEKFVSATHYLLFELRCLLSWGLSLMGDYLGAYLQVDQLFRVYSQASPRNDPLLIMYAMEAMSLCVLCSRSGTGDANMTQGQWHERAKEWLAQAMHIHNVCYGGGVELFAQRYSDALDLS